MSFSRKIRTKYDEGFGPDKFNLGSFALPRVEAKKIRIFFENVHVKSNAFALKTSVSSVKGTTSTNKDKKIKCFLYKGWLAIVRSPDPLADGSDFFKVRRGPCLGSTSTPDKRQGIDSDR